MKTKELEILVLIGIPASGKSTWAKDFARRNPDWARVNRDDFRLMLKNAQVCDPKIEDMITDLTKETIRKCLMRKLNVIVDNTNLKLKYINEIVEEFKYSANINFRVFDISLDKAIERDEQRESKVGTGVITKMFNDYKKLIDTFDFQPVTKTNRPHLVPDFNSKKEQAIVFDINGTLALMGDRSAFDWMKVYKDEKNEIVAEHVDFHRSKGRKIILVSGRDESCRKLTQEWLEMYGIHYDYLYMRPENDYRKDTIIKREIYQNKIEGIYNVLAVYDDRLQVLDMWYDQNIFTFNVNQGNHEF